MQKRNPGPRSNETNCICSMHPESKFSCVRFMFRTFKLFAWFRHTYGVKKCICCFSIFSTPRLFALFAASPGFKLYLQLFYLWYPPPICVLYHPYWVRTACNCMYYFSIFKVPPPIYIASDFTLNRFCNPLKPLKEECDWRNSTQQNCKAGTQDQDPTKQMPFLGCTQGQRFHLWCSFLVPSRYSHDIRMV